MSSQLLAVPDLVALAAGSVLPCQDDPDLFFAESPHAVKLARELCAECPVREACLAGALEREERWGVWGGQLFVDGRIVAFKRGRGRPRKNPVAA